ncbi:hypothetical protein ACIBCM_04820 [Streptomyces sp. NPDC051018]|uniref:hypothetical protein n=1 Tax=Streptomyces sp. NPDC051018 TaxID=3365639 RepID=UPI0037AD5FB9
MAEIELTDELVALERAALKAREEAMSGTYSTETWRPWLTASIAAQTAITEHARQTGQNRVDVEMAVKRAARET